MKCLFLLIKQVCYFKNKQLDLFLKWHTVIHLYLDYLLNFVHWYRFINCYLLFKIKCFNTYVTSILSRVLGTSGKGYWRNGILKLSIVYTKYETVTYYLFVLYIFEILFWYYITIINLNNGILVIVGIKLLTAYYTYFLTVIQNYTILCRLT